ncbi:MAG: glycosyltransferase family 2 protein [Armatimonadetes bacterium]|nr:glycosyltransferase family 2 protein [Armatimonadota bacterium]
MDISVILSTWNNSNRLRITLEAISQCKVPEGILWELVLVNNNCTDETDEVARNFADKLPILYIKEPRQGLSRAKNAGIKAARGKLIIFTDDDVKPCRDWIAIYWSAYQANPEGYFWGGPIESEFGNGNIDEELVRLAPPSVKGLSFGSDMKILSPDEYLVAANWACPAEAIRTAGGFDISTGLNPASGKVIVGEETDLMSRLMQMGLVENYLPEAGIKHFVPEDKCSLGHILSRFGSISGILGQKI